MTVSVDGVNIKEGLARFAGNEKIYTKSLLRFASNYPPLPFDADEEERKKYCHSIKGVAGNLGIYELSAVAAQAEQAPSDMEKYAALTEHMNRMCEIIKSALETAPEESAAPVKSGAGGSKQEYLELIAKLKTAASGFNPSECEKIVEKLRSTEWDGITLPDLSPLVKAVDEYDFAAVPLFLDKL